MATNQVYQYSREMAREWAVPAGTVAGSPVIQGVGQPGVAITARADATTTFNHPDGTIVTVPIYGIGQTAGSATVAVDGTWAFPVVGASGATTKGTLVYAVTTGTAPNLVVTGLTLTVGSNTKFGIVDSFPGKATAGRTAVKIGVFI